MGSTFFCKVCLTDKSTGEQSPDPRYCQSCCDFMVKEIEFLAAQGHRREASWPIIPTMPSKKACDKVTDKETEGGGRVTATIAHLARAGMGCRAIEAELKASGVTMSYRTVARRLQGVLL